LLSGIAKPADTAEQVKDAQSHFIANAYRGATLVTPSR
jgi:hypothetical protein